MDFILENSVKPWFYSDIFIFEICRKLECGKVEHGKNTVLVKFNMLIWKRDDAWYSTRQWAEKSQFNTVKSEFSPVKIYKNNVKNQKGSKIYAVKIIFLTFK